MIRRHPSCRILMLFVLLLLFCCARGTALGDTWTPVSTGFSTEIKISTSEGNTFAEVALVCSDAGFRVANWGEVTRNGSEFSVDVKVERWTGGSAQVITTLKHTYALGALAPGAYSFTVKIYGSVAKTMQFSIGTATPPNPRLLTEENSDRAIALESAIWTRDPFIATNSFSLDRRTRAMLFATDVELGQGEGLSVVTAQAEDSQQRTYPLTVEYIGKVRNLSWLTQVIIQLPEVESAGDVWLIITVRGTRSNRVLISINH